MPPDQHRAVAWNRGETKQADAALWILYALGAVGVFAGIPWCIDLDGTQALMQRRYRFTGDGAVLAAMARWFPTSRA